ncbi:class I SAM-dependent methyltransferase [Halorubrum ezzemoulense]|jgi:ubiquinone/menaquinone biosynthesis C-methylase UbiE|uniref:Class I SAM-dependent methyltransferase n=2 Tax=Halorubrum ezzemoulense TaxID=337243 RepID=A0A256J0R8_HALEZ|nr:MULTISPECIES: class I SAM-dependent methyltransferase [Halorubrum]MDB2236718.1 class I SAM-dependent methyltransferase [Halorubrum ezzemoulense]MDB2242368.1 class I SAM-dependent methyltransferase [Halorubrum ezzemoulense]MDB2244624.1 class I SAM-dependent methyltransferase [Halorubrum ezzemoulense]MDB2247293.1 class I SAM-dependent methyltransferase [Halorubrum ezzemoulense]MDB2250831.1 class I SAM-dependent methyltransferase [Halorubrum ezzemoulense]
MDPQPTGDPQSTYDRIATHFSKTRQYAWPEVESFLEGRSGGLALDVGCGNGRHTEALAARTETAVGLDLSRGLLAEATARARDRGFADATAFVHGDATALPVRDGAVDLAVYVATLHHLSPRSARVESLNELARVLAPGGVALVSAWSTAHDRFDRDEGFDTTVDWTLPGGETVPRYYHIYSPAEFETDLGESALETRRTELSSGNCYAEVEPERP